MQFRKFGNTDLCVSEIGFGAWAIGGAAMIGDTAIGWGDADDTISISAIKAALDAGINFFDTADVYGLGHSETLLGKIIGTKKDVLIATKGGNVARAEKFTVDYSKAHLINACEASLRRLKRETIDYYQLHTVRLQHLQNGECIQAMNQLQKQGKIRYWGVSLNTFEPLPEANWCIQENLGNGFQLVLNLLNQFALPILNVAAEKGFGIIARMPLQFGLLTGKFDSSATFSKTDHRKNRLTKEVIGTCADVLQPVWQLCQKYQCSKTQLALSYIKSYAAVATIIPGIRTPEHVTLNTQGLFQLDDADKTIIESLGQKEFLPAMDLIRKQG